MVGQWLEKKSPAAASFLAVSVAATLGYLTRIPTEKQPPRFRFCASFLADFLLDRVGEGRLIDLVRLKKIKKGFDQAWIEMLPGLFR